MKSFMADISRLSAAMHFPFGCVDRNAYGGAQCDTNLLNVTGGLGRLSRIYVQLDGELEAFVQYFDYKLQAQTSIIKSFR